MLKFRYPQSLSFVSGTAVLEVEGNQVSIQPVANAVNNQDFHTYLAFVLSSDTFGGPRKGKITFALLANRANEAARIAVAAATRDLNLPDHAQFNVQDPKFGSDAAVTIRIRG